MKKSPTYQEINSNTIRFHDLPFTASFNEKLPLIIPSARRRRRRLHCFSNNNYKLLGANQPPVTKSLREPCFRLSPFSCSHRGSPSDDWAGSLLIKIVPSSHYVAFSNDILEYPSNRVGMHIFSEKRRGERLETKSQGNIPSVTSWDLHSFKTLSTLSSIGGNGDDLVLHQQKTV